MLDLAKTLAPEPVAPATSMLSPSFLAPSTGDIGSPTPASAPAPGMATFQDGAMSPKVSVPAIGLIHPTPTRARPQPAELGLIQDVPAVGSIMSDIDTMREQFRLHVPLNVQLDSRTHSPVSTLASNEDWRLNFLASCAVLLNKLEVNSFSKIVNKLVETSLKPIENFQVLLDGCTRNLYEELQGCPQYEAIQSKLDPVLVPNYLLAVLRTVFKLPINPVVVHYGELATSHSPPLPVVGQWNENFPSIQQCQFLLSQFRAASIDHLFFEEMPTHDTVLSLISQANAWITFKESGLQPFIEKSLAMYVVTTADIAKLLGTDPNLPHDHPNVVKGISARLAEVVMVLLSAPFAIRWEVLGYVMHSGFLTFASESEEYLTTIILILQADKAAWDAIPKEIDGLKVAAFLLMTGYFRLELMSLGFDIPPKALMFTRITLPENFHKKPLIGTLMELLVVGARLKMETTSAKYAEAFNTKVPQMPDSDLKVLINRALKEFSAVLTGNSTANHLSKPNNRAYVYSIATSILTGCIQGYVGASYWKALIDSSPANQASASNWKKVQEIVSEVIEFHWRAEPDESHGMNPYTV
jgi:hypothetical protein